MLNGVVYRSTGSWYDVKLEDGTFIKSRIKSLLKKNYYNIRSKKVINLIMRVNSKNFKKTTLGGCLFFIKKDHLCLKIEEKH